MFLKTTSEGRQRAKQKRHEEELEREKRNQQDEKKRLYVLTHDFLFWQRKTKLIYYGQALRRENHSCLLKLRFYMVHCLAF